MYIFDYYKTEISKLISLDESKVKFWWNRYEHVDGDYVVYQTEDLNHEHKRSSEYIQFLDKASKVYDYSVNNLKWYPKSEFRPWLPKAVSASTSVTKEIDVIFYGGMSNRRQDIINNISNRYNVLYVPEFSGIEHHKEMLSKSNYVLSLGFFDNDYNDFMKVTPALDFGANILLESNNESWYIDYLKINFKERITFL